MEFIETKEALRAVYKPAGSLPLEKEMRRLDKHARAFIAASPFVVIASQDDAGHGDSTPKGDRPGFVAILDDTAIAIPDRPGNNRLDTLENVLANPAVGLLFLIPGMNETLRINGRARITADPEMCARFAVNGKPAVSVMIVAIDAVYMHCAKAFLRSGLWNPESWQPRAAMPTLGEILKDQLALKDSAEETDRFLDDAYAKTMW